MRTAVGSVMSVARTIPGQAEDPDMVLVPHRQADLSLAPSGQQRNLLPTNRTLPINATLLSYHRPP